VRSVGVRVGDYVYKALVERARAEGVSISEVVRRAVVAYLGFPAEKPLDVRVRELEDRVSRLEREVSALKRTLCRVAPEEC